MLQLELRTLEANEEEFNTWCSYHVGGGGSLHVFQFIYVYHVTLFYYHERTIPKYKCRKQLTDDVFGSLTCTRLVLFYLGAIST